MNSFFIVYTTLVCSLITNSLKAEKNETDTSVISSTIAISSLSVLPTSTQSISVTPSFKSLSIIVSTSALHSNVTSVISSSIKPSVVSSNVVVSSSVTPPPTPDPNMLVFQFPKNGTPCIKFEGEIELTISGNKLVDFFINRDDSVIGSCIGLPNVTLTDKTHDISLTMSFNRTQSHWQLVNIQVKDNNNTLMESAASNSINIPVLMASINNSYTCNDKLEVIQEDMEKNQVKVIFTKLRVQAYLTSASFSNSTDTCPSKSSPEKTSSVVPIAVGGALAGLIVIVLVAYLIGRRRGNRGYQKV
ncbi:lysosome-associated membrane glycoprotein 1 isoform X1 [Hydra vulgaris]|uniref:lysosome-associated membrane glycoprotein 1 isoform X1 n=1 Tax=Hydra vulgaris TaxID=6087 RepID=UPI0001923B86|nr:lysosome-associated membrane glycoprotein 1 [Hydra vulgaris]